MPTEGHEVPRVITSSQDLWDDVVDGAIFTRSGLTTVGTASGTLFPHLTGFVLLGAALDAAHGLLVILYIGKTLIYTIFKTGNIIDILLCGVICGWR